MKGGFQVYRCRMCGARVREEESRDLMMSLLQACTHASWTNRLQLPHDCGDGRAGVMDLIGGEYKETRCTVPTESSQSPF